MLEIEINYSDPSRLNRDSSMRIYFPTQATLIVINFPYEAHVDKFDLNALYHDLDFSPRQQHFSYMYMYTRSIIVAVRISTSEAFNTYFSLTFTLSL